MTNGWAKAPGAGGETRDQIKGRDRMIGEYGTRVV